MSESTNPTTHPGSKHLRVNHTALCGHSIPANSPALFRSTCNECALRIVLINYSLLLPRFLLAGGAYTFFSRPKAANDIIFDFRSARIGIANYELAVEEAAAAVSKKTGANPISKIPSVVRKLNRPKKNLRVRFNKSLVRVFEIENVKHLIEAHPRPGEENPAGYRSRHPKMMIYEPSLSPAMQRLVEIFMDTHRESIPLTFFHLPAPGAAAHAKVLTALSDPECSTPIQNNQSLIFELDSNPAYLHSTVHEVSYENYHDSQHLCIIYHGVCVHNDTGATDSKSTDLSTCSMVPSGRPELLKVPVFEVSGSRRSFG